MAPASRPRRPRSRTAMRSASSPTSVAELYFLDAARHDDQGERHARARGRRPLHLLPRARGEFQTQPVEFTGEHWYYKRNDWPYAGTVAHYLIVPLRHVVAFDELPDEAGAELWAIKRAPEGAAGAAGDRHGRAQRRHAPQRRQRRPPARALRRARSATRRRRSASGSAREVRGIRLLALLLDAREHRVEVAEQRLVVLRDAVRLLLEAVRAAPRARPRPPTRRRARSTGATRRRR